MTQEQELERLLADGSVWRSSALRAAGIRPQAIANALKAGRVARSAAGAYYLPGSGAPLELVGLAAACSKMPEAVACLLSAAHLAGLTRHPPKEIWLALPSKAHAAKEGQVPQRILRWGRAGALGIGVFERELCGVRVRHTGPARTVVDLLWHARHVGGTDEGIRAARRLMSLGGSLGEVRAIAEQIGAPKDTMRMVSMLKAALTPKAARAARDPGE